MKKTGRILLFLITAMTVLGIIIITAYFLFPDVFKKEEVPAISVSDRIVTGDPISTADQQDSETGTASSDVSASGNTDDSADSQLPASASEENESTPAQTQEPTPSPTPQPTPEPTQTPEPTPEPPQTPEPTQTPTPVPTSEASPTPAPEETANPSPESISGPTPVPVISGVDSSGNYYEDQRAPIFFAFTANPKIKVGSTFDIHKYIGYGDDVDRDVELTVSGEVDTSKEGTYNLKVTLRDDAGRSISKDMKVQVMKTLPSGGSSGGGSKEAFSDFISKYKTDETSVGIDISRWQETVDFEKVKNAGCEFVYMRLGGFDNGEHYTDRYFANNLAGAKAAGLKIGVYWHSEECNADQVKASVNYLMDVLGGEHLDFPIIYDWEDYKNFEQYGMNLHDLNDCLTAFEEEIESRGYTACLYGSKNAIENYWTKQRRHPIWLAHYTSATSYSGEYFMWQHSSTGRIDGINGDVDLDVLYPARLNFMP